MIYQIGHKKTGVKELEEYDIFSEFENMSSFSSFFLSVLVAL